MPRKKRPAQEAHAGDRARAAIDQRIAKEKANLIAHLKKNPGLSIACQSVGIGRRTYYRWRQEDSAFALQADCAIRDAIALRNDPKFLKFAANFFERHPCRDWYLHKFKVPDGTESGFEIFTRQEQPEKEVSFRK